MTAFFDRLRQLLGDQFSALELGWLIFPPSNKPLLAARRAHMIISRVRLVAMLFAVLTPLWMIVDYAIFPISLFWKLATARLLASMAFAWLSVRGTQGNTMRCAYRALVVMFAIPTLFFIYTYLQVASVPLQGLSAAVGAGYGFLPFVMLVGIAIFPLTTIECLAFATPMLLAQGVAGSMRLDILSWPSFAGAFWLLILITAVATLASMSQLALMIALVRQATRDPLTGCLSRGSGEELIEHLIRVSQRGARPLCVAFIDLDHFKQVNDHYGHEAGDHVLRTAIDCMGETLRSSDRLIRWGGEEFIVLMPDTDIEQAIIAAGRLREKGFGRRPDGMPVTASIGIAEYFSDQASDAQNLIEIADQRMYIAKQGGRDRIVAKTESYFGG